MIPKGISVIQLNPYAVKQTKGFEDNSQRRSLQPGTAEKASFPEYLLLTKREGADAYKMAEKWLVERIIESGTTIRDREASESRVAHVEEFKEHPVYYKTMTGNSLKKMQSLIVNACKLMELNRSLIIMIQITVEFF